MLIGLICIIGLIIGVDFKMFHETLNPRPNLEKLLNIEPIFPLKVHLNQNQTL